MQVCLPRGQAACCAHAAFLKREQNCLSHSWLRQKPSPRRSPCSSSGFCRVQKEFAKAGLSAAASNKVLKKCQMYLQWDCESKLQPALQLWLQELGSEKLREVLQYAPHLLERNPADCEEVFMWLLLRIPYTGNCYKEPRKWWHTRTFGVDAALIQRKQPEVMLQKLDDVRKTIDSVRWNADFTELQLRSFLHHHCLALLFSGDHAVDVLRAVAKALQLPMTSAGVRKTILLAHPQLFGLAAAAIEQRMLYYCSKYGSERSGWGTMKMRMVFARCLIFM